MNTGMTFRSSDESMPLEFIKGDSPSSTRFYAGGEEILRLDNTGMTYKGQRIEDAGEAHRAFLETMKAVQQSCGGLS